MLTPDPQFIIQRNKKGEYEDALKAAEAGKK